MGGVGKLFRVGEKGFQFGDSGFPVGQGCGYFVNAAGQAAGLPVEGAALDFRLGQRPAGASFDRALTGGVSSG